MDALDGAVELCRGAGDSPALAEALTLLGRTFAAIPGLATRAATTLATARRLWQAAADPDGAVAAQLGLAETYLATARELGPANAAGARAAARQALTAAEVAVREADAAGLSELSVDARLTVVEALLEADGPDPAVDRALDSAATMLARFPSPTQQVVWHRQAAAHRLRRSDPAAAADQARAGLQLAADRTYERERLLGLLALALDERGDLVGALATTRLLNAALEDRARQSAQRRSAVIAARLDAERALAAAERQRRQVAALAARNAELAWAAAHAPLTGLANRRALTAALQAACAQPGPVAVCLLDVDHFKRVNDTCSHQVGDQVLVRLAQALRTAVRAADLPARYGGEELALVLPGADAAVASAVAEQLRAFIAALLWPVELPDGRITVSIGVAAATGPVDPDALLARADEALYAAKRSGRNTVVCR